MTNKIGVGLIGLSARGGWAGTAHVPALRALGELYEIRGLTASTAASAQAAAEKFGVAYGSDDPMALAQRPDIDLVVVSVKVPQHRVLVEAAVAAGKAVYCEWPLGNGLDEAVHLAALAQARGVRHFVGLQARAAPPLAYLRDLLAQGYVGEVLSTTLVADGDRPWGGLSFPGSTYLNDARNGATMLSIPFGHSVDALCQLLGGFETVSGLLAVRRPRVPVSGSDEVLDATAPDQVAVHGRLVGGAVASIHFRGGRSRGLGCHWEINGTEGDLVVTGPNGHLQYGRLVLRGGRGRDRTLAELPVPPAYRQVGLPADEPAHALAHAYAQVAADLRDGGRRAPGFDAAVATHRLLDAIERSAREGHVNRVP